MCCQSIPASHFQILCHGLSYNLLFWDLGEEVSLPRYLADAGYDVWSLSLRDATPSSQPLSSGPGIESATPTLNTSVDSFFDITYHIEFAGGAYSLLNLTGTPGAGLAFSDVAVIWTGVDSFFDVFFELSYDNPTMLDLDNEPLMHMTMTGEYIPEPATLTLVLLGGLALVRRKSRRLQARHAGPAD